MDRRDFIKRTAAGSAATFTAASMQDAEPAEPSVINLRSDGLRLHPAEYAALLGRLSRDGLAIDSYSRGGVVESLETEMAGILGKERAIFMPTGTMANQIAVRKLCEGRGRKVVVQAESHLNRDSGDCAQTLSGLDLVPLAEGETGFRSRDLQRVLDRVAAGRVATKVGALVIESPVRRRRGQVFDIDEMKRISGLARDRGIGRHLDGARIFLASAYSGIPVHDYAALFDTVYVSLYKYFNAASGAILAGPAKTIDGLYHTRRMFGGGMPQSWPYAAVALHFLDGFSDRFKRAVEISERLIQWLNRRDDVDIERIPNGTNVFRASFRGFEPTKVRQSFARQSIELPPPASDNRFDLKVNESLVRTHEAILLKRFEAALSDQ